MPAAAILCTGRPASSAAARRTDPATRPPGSASPRARIAWHSVVLPMPLRAMTATGSSPTVKVAPCTMWALPYQASSPSTASSGSAMLRPQVERLHQLGRADLVGRALDHHGAVVHHRDPVGDPERDVHVVLDEHHGDVAVEREQQLREELALARREAGGRLVEHDDLGAPGEGDAQLELALLAVGDRADQRVAAAGQPHALDQRVGRGAAALLAVAA